MTRITVKFNADDEPIKIHVKCHFSDNHIVKSIAPNCRFDSLRKHWDIPFSFDVLEKLSERFPEAVEDSVWEKVEAFKHKNMAIAVLKSQQDAQLKSKLSQYLYNYQRVCVQFLLKAGNSLLADDMGIGKTLESICMCEELDESPDGQNLKVLVVCPNSLKWTWAYEIENWKTKTQTWDPEKTAVVIDGTKKKKQKLWARNAKYTIINYEAVPNSLEVFYNDPQSVIEMMERTEQKRKEVGLPPLPKKKHVVVTPPDKVWDVLLIDEGHRIKNRKSLYSEVIKLIKAKKVVVITGTPIMNRLDELWSLLNRLYPTRYSSYWAFVDKYCLVEETMFGKKIVGAKNVDELQKELAPIMIRRTKEEIMQDLPDKSYQRILVEMSPVQKKLYNEMKNEMIAYYMKTLSDISPSNLINHVKENRLAEKVIVHYGTRENDSRSIHHNELEMHLMLKSLDNLNEKYMLYDVRNENVMELKKDDDPENTDYEYLHLHKWLEQFQNRPERVAIVVCDTEKYHRALQQVGQIQVTTLLSQTTRLRQIAISAGLVTQDAKAESPKLDTLIDILPDYLENNRKAVVMTQFAKALEMLEPRLKAAKIPYVKLTGETPIAERQKLVKQFQENDNIKLFLSTIQAGGVGITLTRASTIFFLDRHWTPAMNEQAEDRVHRTGQKNNVLVVDLIAKNTIEGHIWDLLHRKQKLFEQAIDYREIIDALRKEEATA